MRRDRSSPCNLTSWTPGIETSSVYSGVWSEPGAGDDELAERLLAFGAYYRQIARPFQWTFTRHDLNRALARIADRDPTLQLAA